MQKYEIMAIVKNSLDADKAQKVCQEVVLEKIKSFKGTVSFEDFWGERGFAYKIKQMTWGYYFVAQFEMESAEISTFRKELNIEKDIVRFLITSVDKNAPTPLKYAEVKAANEAQEKKTQAEVSEKKEATASKRREKLTTIKSTTSENKESAASTTGVKEKAEEKTQDKKERSVEPKKTNSKNEALDDLIAQSAADL